MRVHLKPVRTLALILGLVHFAYGQNPPHSYSDSEKAQKAWDALVAAKGGRERLGTISNVLFTLYSHNKRDEPPGWLELYVLPNQAWRTGYHLDMTMTTYRWNGSKQEWAGDGVYDSNNGDPTDALAMKRILYLLETRSEAPTPLAVRREKLDSKNVDVIRCDFRGKKLDFYFDPEEMLVLQVVRYFPDGSPLERYRFFDYIDVTGIKLPQRETSSLFNQPFPNPWPIGIDLNVDYDPNLFTQPMRVGGFSDWKRRHR